MRSTGGDTTEYEPDVEKFRDVVEAYSVLSQREARASYDLSIKKNPDQYTARSDKQHDMEFRRDMRDKSGVTPKDAPKKGSYAEERLAQLKVEREKYNVNYLGYYRGGLPSRGRGAMRGTAMGNPGEVHSVQMHNFLEYNH